MEDLFFPVEKVPVRDLGITMPVPSGVSHAIVARTEKPQILSFCSEDYGLTRNEEIARTFEDVIKTMGYQYDFHGHAHGKSVFKMEWAIKAYQEDIGGDQVLPRIFVYNSYNRSVKFSFGISLMRVICSNGMVVWEDRLMSKLLHTPAIEGTLSAEKCIPMLSEFIGDYQDILEPYDYMASVKVPNIEQRLEEIYESTKFPMYLMDTVRDRLSYEMISLGLNKATDWLLYCAFNYAIVHEESLIGRKGDTMDKQVMSYLLGETV